MYVNKKQELGNYLTGFACFDKEEEAMKAANKKRIVCHFNVNVNNNMKFIIKITF